MVSSLQSVAEDYSQEAPKILQELACCAIIKAQLFENHVSVIVSCGGWWSIWRTSSSQRVGLSQELPKLGGFRRCEWLFHPRRILAPCARFQCGFIRSLAVASNQTRWLLRAWYKGSLNCVIHSEVWDRSPRRLPTDQLVVTDGKSARPKGSRSVASSVNAPQKGPNCSRDSDACAWWMKEFLDYVVDFLTRDYGDSRF